MTLNFLSRNHLKVYHSKPQKNVIRFSEIHIKFIFIAFAYTSTLLEDAEKLLNKRNGFNEVSVCTLIGTHEPIREQVKKYSSKLILEKLVTFIRK